MIGADAAITLLEKKYLAKILLRKSRVLRPLNI